MTLTTVPLISALPVVLGIGGFGCAVLLVVLCVCGKSKQNEEPELKHVTATNTLNDSLHRELPQPKEVNGASAVHIDIDGAHSGTPLLQNGTASRGSNSSEHRNERHSQVSGGSSPRPTSTRELPEIPHPSSLESSHRGGNLPDIPGSATHRKTNSLGNSVGSEKPSSRGSKQGGDSDLDDYDHLDEKKRKQTVRRSDYDHVVLQNETPKVQDGASGDSAENDYAEVKNENYYEGVPEDIQVVRPKSSTTPKGYQHTKDTDDTTAIKVNFDDPYNRVKDEIPYADFGTDDPYNKVKEDDPYNKVKDDDPYNKVKGDDPYNKVKGDDPYNKVKSDDPYNRVKDDDPYNKVKDGSEVKVHPKRRDHYSSIKNEDPYNIVDDERNVSNQSSTISDSKNPYARVNGDDPYAQVKDDTYAKVSDTDIIDDYPYNKVQDSSESSAGDTQVPHNSGLVDDSVVRQTDDAEYAVVNKTRTEVATSNSNQGASSLSNSHHGNIHVQTMEASGATVDFEAINNEYAKVSKPRKQSDLDQKTSPEPHAPASNPLIPPEPPRAYREDSERSNPNDEVMVIPPEVSVTADQTTIAKKKDPSYTKLTARESLASMNARIAQNTYEVVPDADNLYATVEGGSGDGVVIPRESTQPGSPPTLRPPVEARDSTISDHYAEIGAAAPAPPSLDSLHYTVHQEEKRRRTERYYSNIDEDMGSSPVGGATSSGHFRTPSGDFVKEGANDVLDSAISAGTMMNAAYQSADYIPNNDVEIDPNYESVEEAEARLNTKSVSEKSSGVTEKKIRAHVYEEVTITNEATRVRQHVLSQHTYEDITDVNKNKKDLEKNTSERSSKRKKDKGQSAAEGQSSSEVQRRSFGHQRKSSGDQSSGKNGKRKSAEPKDKSRDSKRKQFENKDKVDSKRKSRES